MKKALLVSLLLISPTGLMAAPLAGQGAAPSLIVTADLSGAGRDRSVLNVQTRTRAEHESADGALRKHPRSTKDLVGPGQVDPCLSPTKMLRTACFKGAASPSHNLTGDITGPETWPLKEPKGSLIKGDKGRDSAGLAPFKGCVKPVKKPSGPQRSKDCVEVKPLVGRG